MRRALRAAIAVVAVLTTVSCEGTTSVTRATSVNIVEKDFKISVPSHVKAGDVVLTVTNEGPDDHELIVVSAPDKRLPMRGDGLTVAEEKFEPVGALEAGAPGAVRRLELHLKPGHYVLFCNMSGHFLGGMNELIVAQ